MKINNGDQDRVPPESSGDHERASAATEPAPVAIRAVKRILVPVDFSICSLKALDYARDFAGQLGAAMTVLHVVEAAPHDNNYLSVSSSFDQAAQNQLEERRERLTEIGLKHVGQRLASDYLVRMGRAPSEILDTAKALGVDMIVLGTHGQSGLKHTLLGSTAEKVLRQAPCPVVTVSGA